MTQQYRFEIQYSNCLSLREAQQAIRAAWEAASAGEQLELYGHNEIVNTAHAAEMLQWLGINNIHQTQMRGDNEATIESLTPSEQNLLDPDTCLYTLREHGYLGEAVFNFLFHGKDDDAAALLTFDNSVAQNIAPAEENTLTSKDSHKLLHWQHLAVAQTEAGDYWQWLGEEVANLVTETQRQEFDQLVKKFIVFPRHAKHWAEVLYKNNIEYNEHAREAIDKIDRVFFEQALVSLDLHPGNNAALLKELSRHTGLEGNTLKYPLRAALTGELAGPDLEKLMSVLGPEKIRHRLHSCLHK